MFWLGYLAPPFMSGTDTSFECFWNKGHRASHLVDDPDNEPDNEDDNNGGRIEQHQQQLCHIIIIKLIIIMLQLSQLKIFSIQLKPNNLKISIFHF
jgi:hypothetical protein